MKGNKEIKVEFTLVLSEQEVLWLRDYLQNSYNAGETPENTKIREELFNGLNMLLHGPKEGNNNDSY